MFSREVVCRSLSNQVLVGANFLLTKLFRGRSGAHFHRLLKKAKITQSVMPNSFRHLIEINRLGAPETSSG